MAIPDKAGMTEALKSADSSHFGDRAHLFPGLTERGRNIRDQNDTEALALSLALPQPIRVFSVAVEHRPTATAFITCFY